MTPGIDELDIDKQRRKLQRRIEKRKQQNVFEEERMQQLREAIRSGKLPRDASTEDIHRFSKEIRLTRPRS